MTVPWYTDIGPILLTGDLVVLLFVAFSKRFRDSVPLLFGIFLAAIVFLVVSIATGEPEYLRFQGIADGSTPTQALAQATKVATDEIPHGLVHRRWTRGQSVRVRQTKTGYRATVTVRVPVWFLDPEYPSH